jgi:hypothetical protein
MKLIPRLMAREAFTLGEAARQLRLELEEHTGYRKHIVAAVLLDALAIEIALKCIFTVERNFQEVADIKKELKQSERHDLRAIFDRLSGTTKADLDRRFWELMPPKRTMVGIPGHDDLVTFRESHDGSFAGRLGELRKAFETFRYAYEKERGVCADETFAMVCSRTIVEHALRITGSTASAGAASSPAP